MGGSSGIGLETARRAREEGAEVVLAARDPHRLEQAAKDLQPLGTAAFDATDASALERFFGELPGPVDHVMVTAGGPYYAPLQEMDFDDVRRVVDQHLMLPLYVGRCALGKVRAGGTLVFMSGTGGRRVARGYIANSALTAAGPALVANLALEIAPIRANVIAAGFVDTPLSASLLGDDLDSRREELRSKLPIGRVVEPADVADLAVHIMANTALTGATFDIDGGQQLVS